MSKKFDVVQYAKDELKSLNQIVQKMHIVEAEIVQQLSMVDRVLQAKTGKAEVKLGSTGNSSKYALNFPYEGEAWLDEIDNFRVDIKKACVANQ